MDFNSELPTLIDTALQDSEIAASLQKASLPKKFIADEILRRREKVMDAIKRELADIKAKREALSLEQKEFEQSRPLPWRVVVWTIWLLRICIAISIGFSGISAFSAWQAGGWPALPGWLRAGIKPEVIPLVLAVLMPLLPLLVLQRRRKTAKLVYERFSPQARAVSERESEITAITRRTKEKLLNDGIKTEIREFIREHTTPSYSTILSVREASGLREILDPAYEVTTAARLKLADLLGKIPGGSIGIAGPRGAGKSTLMASFCRPNAERISERPVVAILTSTPVKYDGRDFLLHVFSTLCYASIGLEPGATLPPDPEASQAATPSRQFLRNILIPATLFLSLVGGLLFCVALIFRATRSPGATLVSVLDSLGFTADKFAVPGALLMIAALALMAFIVGYRQFTGIEPRPRSIFLRGLEQNSPLAPFEKFDPVVVRRAMELIRDIRFQRSFTSGWSGALKLPVGIEGGASGGQTLAERQRSVPELVDAFRRFVELLTRTSDVIIGIDELDKIAADEQAQQFINEIKSIFNLSHCYYLISVSESAIVSFERRGLPFRDAFDSAFDTIIHVDYLNLESSRTLIGRRVIGLEAPFLDLCFCLSGGLPRDLIRSCRELLGIAWSSTPPVTRLDALCEKIVLNEVQTKLRVTAVSARSSANHPETGDFLLNLHRLEAAASRRAIFLAARSRVLMPEITLGRAEASRLAHVELETGIYAYLYFAATLLEFFDRSLTEERLRLAERSGAIDQLARARQNFALNPRLVAIELDLFRVSQGLTPDVRRESTS